MSNANNDVHSLDDGVEVEPMMAISGGPDGAIHQPIHESLTLAALVNTGAVPKTTTVANASNADWEYVRGAVWNDDPALLLFNDSSNSNRNYSWGAQWLAAYKSGASEWADGAQGNLRNATGRSHYGDLQFLHCMACKLGEAPTETKGKVMVWAEVMYKLANGEDGITASTLVKDTKLMQFCPVTALPPSFMPLSYLLSKDSAFSSLDFGRRAIGSIFHIIQDSYAIGHTKRRLLNPEDELPNTRDLEFETGVADQWGEILNFHTYSGQDDKAHAHFDHADDKISDPDHLDNLGQWNSLVGCRAAVDKCIGLMNLKQANKKWADGVQQYLDQEVFAVSSEATPADNHVD